jgi:hypothetical protein
MTSVGGMRSLELLSCIAAIFPATILIFAPQWRVGLRVAVTLFGLLLATQIVLEGAHW